MLTIEESMLDLLTQLCDRQMELRAPTHVLVMEAFNRFADLFPAPPLFSVSMHQGSATALMECAVLSLERLAEDETDLGRRLVYGEVSALLTLAAAES